MSAVLLDGPATAPEVGCALALLLQQSAGGAEGVFAQLHRRTWRRLYAVVIRVVRSPELASEVTQEVYLVIWQQCGRFRTDEGSALGWMVTIARRRAIDRVRAVGRASALDRLTWRQREAMVLVHLEERPMAEAARLLGIHVNTAKTRVRDGLQRLRVVLADA